MLADAKSMMRKPIAWALSWALFWIGHVVSRTTVTPRYVDRLPQIWCDCFYCIYNRLMIWSSDVQDWGGVSPELGPWGPAIGEGEE